MKIKGLIIEKTSLSNYNGHLPTAWTPEHELHAFKVYFKDGSDEVFIYQCNRKETPSCLDAIRAYALDAICYYDNMGIDNFLKEFGYDKYDTYQYNVGVSAYEGCRKAYKNLAYCHGLTASEIQEISQWEE